MNTDLLIETQQFLIKVAEEGRKGRECIIHASDQKGLLHGV